MLVPKGKVVRENLSTAYTHLEQLVEGLQSKRFSGYCHVSFWEYDGILFFQAGSLISGLEEIRGRNTQTRKGQTAINNILKKSREKDGTLNLYQLPAKRVSSLLLIMNGVPKYEELSTDLTSLEKVAGLLEREHLSGFIEIFLEDDVGIGNLFFSEGSLTDSLLVQMDNPLIGDSTTFKHLAELCETHGAIFNVYQSDGQKTVSTGKHFETKTVPLKAVKLFEAILNSLETVTDTHLKPGTFQTILKKILPQVADSYAFLDPFIGDFRYANSTLHYEGDATYREFVDGLCDVIAKILQIVLGRVSSTTFLPQLSKAFESVVTLYPHLIEQLELESRLSAFFEHYDASQTAEEHEQQKNVLTRKVLNLQGIGVSDIGSDSILREFYRVITLLTEKYVDPANNTINYSTLRKTREFQQYQTATAFLQQFDPSVLAHHPQEQTAFWLNLYNFLVIDGIIEFSIKSSVHDEKEFFKKTSYRLGEYIFSLDDIEHGILRNNQRRPYTLFHQFSGTDPRKVLCLNIPDPRLHCCFVYGTVSSPPLTVYTPNNLDQQINRSVTRYLQGSGMRVDRKTKTVWLSRSFYWYRKDFEKKKTTLLDFIIRALQKQDVGKFLRENRANLTLRFMDYDWNLNGK